MDPYLEGYLWPDVHHALANKIRQMLGPQLQPRYVARLEILVVKVRLVNVEIRDVAQNVLVTSIEILSPVNKCEPHLSQYRQKRARLRSANVHLLEIDLLRRGARAWSHPRLPETPYFVLLTRAQADEIEVWPIRLQEKLPSVPVPLRAPDADVGLDLSAALGGVYDEAFYHLSIDYTQDPPPPPLPVEDAAWLKEVTLSSGRKVN
jgi:hypothetical protein